MPRRRYAVLLPIALVVVTSGLWLWARSQYLSVTWLPNGNGQSNGWVSWTDFTPIAVQVAGMLNVPVATFGYPLYHLLREDTRKWELIALLVGIVAQWSYIGSVLDTRSSAPFSRAWLRRVAGAVGLLFGIGVLVATIPMYHVGLLYKVVGIVWSLLICRHFLSFLRNPSATVRH